MGDTSVGITIQSSIDPLPRVQATRSGKSTELGIDVLYLGSGSQFPTDWLSSLASVSSDNRLSLNFP